MPGRKVLVPVDNSGYARCALKWYLDNVAKDQDEVVLVHCTEYDYNIFLPGAYVDVEQVSKKAKAKNDEIDIMMNEYMSSLRGGPQIKSRFKLIAGGKPGEEIIKMVDEEQPNMIVMGSRGLGTVRRTVLGSVSDYIVHHAPAHCSISIVRDN